MLSRRTPHRILSVALFLALTGSACTGGDTIDAATSAERSGVSADSGPTWEPCTNDDPTLDLSGVECAVIEVPLDHADPEGPTVELALGRLPAVGQDENKVGSLLTNPGGPGASGIESLSGLGLSLPEDVLASFDIVSWDPRGVGMSTPVRCLSDEGNEAQIEGDLSPDTPDELDHAVGLAEEFRDACVANNSEIIEYMSTTDVAHDMEAIRLALGGEKLNYLGFSYGTAIGAAYATLFPNQVRAMVLDGAVSPDTDEKDMTVEQLKGFELAYGNFVDACADDPECALGAYPAPQIDAVRDRLDGTPMETDTASGVRALGRDLFDVGMATALYDTATWGMLARAIANIDVGGAEIMLALADLQLGRKPDGTWDNSGDAQAMVTCADTEERPDLESRLEEFKEIKPELEAAAPTFASSLGFIGIGCVGWPVAANPVPDFSAPEAPPIMVVGTLGDPATPYEWSEQMAEQLGSGFLVTYEGEGHTGTTRGGECMALALSEYLFEPAVMDDPSCPPVQETDEASSSPFAGVEDMLGDELVAEGAPEDVARCVAEGMVDHYGETRLELSLLQPDLEDQMATVTALTMECMARG